MFKSRPNRTGLTHSKYAHLKGTPPPNPPPNPITKGTSPSLSCMPGLHHHLSKPRQYAYVLASDSNIDGSVPPYLS
ncbi:hypothetical protein DAEQUDRAFT_725598 [Daedalea quercina L-15889]|uniref:Uncharacterized protein n=1 Tax=Daedalea quercina L-15889 TaxID=1314783 RepID=A0A165R535_9APHY|nr:hypothetical protein DAEQUDRAFT_725598 [Daedalea quercina L-15889]